MTTATKKPTKIKELSPPATGDPVLLPENDWEKEIYLRTFSTFLESISRDHPLNQGKNQELLFRSYLKSAHFLCGIAVDEHRRLKEELE